jgi:membrane fusion protein, heavy metal efflux system
VRRRAPAVATASLLAACGQSPAPGKAPPAASVAVKVDEADLGKVTLAPEAASRLGLEIATVERQSAPRLRSAGGEVVVPSGGALQLSAPVAATVATGGRLVALGATVKRGDVLVSLVPIAPVDRDVRAQAGRSESAARARFSAAEARLKRSEALLAEGAGPARAVEEARAEFDTARAELEAAGSRREAVDERPLAADVTVTVRAPHDGVVRQVGVSAGQSVAAGALLVEVVGTSSLWVRVPLFVAEARRVRPDAPARVLPFGEGEPREALPAHAPPLADAAASTVDFFYELGAAHGLRPGERVRVELAQAGEAERLAVPAAALMRDVEGGAWVYEAIGPQTFRRRRVAVERVEGGRALLERGVAAGARVVSVGAAELWGVEFGAGK